jgi:hypothetical protein
MEEIAALQSSIKIRQRVSHNGWKVIRKEI